MLHDAGLQERERLEEFIQRPESPRVDDEPLGGFDHHHLACIEVLKVEFQIHVGVHVLLVRKDDVEADRDATFLAAAAVGGLHHAGATPGDHGEPLTRKEPSTLTRAVVHRVALTNTR